MYRAGLTIESLAEQAEVSPKTAHRWLSGTVTPYPRTRYRVAALLREDESYLWPGAVNGASLAGAELAAPLTSSRSSGCGRRRASPGRARRGNREQAPQARLLGRPRSPRR
jgi:transcriptional regulator with XRE-family HTH domain